MKRQKTIHNEQYCKIVSELRSERKRLGLSQAEVAKALGVSQSDISKIETLERRIDILELKNLLHFFRIAKNAHIRRIIKSYFGLGDK